MPRTADSSDESLLFQTVRDVTAVLFSRLLLTGFLQHNCSTLGPGGTPYNGLYGDAPPERGTFFRLQVYKRVGISQDEVY